MADYIIDFIVIFLACCVLRFQKIWNSDRKYSRINVHFDKHKEQELQRR